MSFDVAADDLRSAIARLGLAGTAVCVHSAMRSFGRLEGGAASFVDAFLAEGCTLLVPTFSYAEFAVAPPEGMRPARNGMDDAPLPAGSHHVFTSSSVDIDAHEMGAIPSDVLRRDGRVRGHHPLASFTAVGERAEQLTRRQSPHDPFAPLKVLSSIGGRALLAGVGLNRLTLLHLAETDAGRRPFVRWARDEHGTPSMVAVGGCSEGFPSLEPFLAPRMTETGVGPSRWLVFDAASARADATRAMLEQPSITHCDDPHCRRCPDAIAGGPIP